MIFRRFLVLTMMISSFGWTEKLAREQRTDEQKTQALLHECIELTNKFDFDGLLTKFAPTFVLIMADLETIETREHFRSYFKEFAKKSAGLKSELVYMSPTRFLSDSSAVIFGKESISHNGKPVMENVWTTVLSKSKGEWKIAAMQSGVRPLASPAPARASTIRVDYLPALYWLLGGLAMGLAIAYLLKWFRH